MITKQEMEQRLKKEMVFSKEFIAEYSNENDEEKGAFDAYNLALEFCKNNNICVGSMERSSPIGLALNTDYISKWSNLGADVQQLDGVLLSESFRSAGKVTLYFSKVLI